ncbi:hypothetical protein Moror_4410 [Moniliophthora roreri MCA 2997]|uniref:DUF6593 domain-containing protein n=2 Tax=Moniliophthora roreri TaxID=221103 RepID=V2YLF1_MONRO|nr:hypothetical protein Moror_4410 [Moniliophthora roreri MCA 2997]
MVFTPPGTLVIRSREYGDGSEFSATSIDIIPDHYVKRLWRKPAAFTSSGARKVTFINKTPSSNDRSVAFSTFELGNRYHIKHGDGGSDILSIEWQGENLKAMERSSLTVGNKTTAVKDVIKKSAMLGSTSQSRTFVAPDGLEYKWKVVYCGSNPAFPDCMYFELYTKDSKHPVATTARLTSRDGSYTDESYPVYIAERGITIVPWIVATHAVMNKLLKA